MKLNTLNSINLNFQPNLGQIDSDVKFICKGLNYTLFFKTNEFIFKSFDYSSKKRHFLKYKLLNSICTTIEGLNNTKTRYNYFKGNNENKWICNIISYEKIKYHNVYNNIDLIYYNNGRNIEWDFILYPGSNPEDIKIEFPLKTNMNLDDEGNILVHINSNIMTIKKPYIYQNINNKIHPIDGSFNLSKSNIVSFNIDSYDLDHNLIIDPVLSYSTFLGGTGDDQIYGIALDSNKDIYVTGFTNSADFPTVNPIYSYKGDYDVFITKIDSSGSFIIYSTYISGTFDEWANDICVDSSGNAYVTGFTKSSDFPTKDPIQSTKLGVKSAFLTKLDSTGSSLIYSTFIGGNKDDEAKSMALDSNNNVYLIGITDSTNFPLISPYQSTISNYNSAFICKVASSGNSLLYSTYLGGASIDEGYDITLDSNNNMYLTGTTYSSDFPTKNPIESSLSGQRSAFITILSADGSNLIFSTFLGGSGADDSNSIVIDNNNNIFIAGTTFSSDFPLVNPIQNTKSGFFSAFVCKIASGGTHIIFSTYLGGSGFDYAYAIDLDSEYNPYISGFSTSSDFPTVDSVGPVISPTGLYITKIQSDGSSILFSSLLTYASGNALTLDSDNTIYVAGTTDQSAFPTVNPLQSTYAGNNDSFILKITQDTATTTTRGYDFIEFIKNKKK